MRISPLVLFSLILCAVLTACGADPSVPSTPLSDIPLIPIPVSVSDIEGSFDLQTLSTEPVLSEAAGNVEAYLSEQGNWLSKKLAANANGSAKLTFIADASLPEEGYRLEVLPKGVTIAASTELGSFYGLQTFRQLAEFAAMSDNGRLALGTITDSPRYGYRGLMLDIARHYHKPTEIKRLMDLMAQYKLNRLHLHLTDDQGWRIEIKSWPKLTTVGGSTQVGGKSGGFLTQEAYADLHAYAKTRGIIIIPEIDMPGHTQSALASYPELNCNPKDPNPKLYEGTEVGFSTFCIGKPIVMKFVTDVLTELAAITPGPYLHIGGDESHVTDSTDYRKFIAEVEPVVRGLGKRMVGWDETVTADIDESAVLHFWASKKNAQLAAKKGHKILMSPATNAYLDMQYDSTSRIGLHWAAYIEVDEGYTWDPATLVEGINDDNILGLEAPLWSETVVERGDIDYLVFPRALGYAEMAWSPAAKRDWSTYRTRLAKHAVRLDAQGVAFYRSAKVDWPATRP
ncbi:MAG: family 20 glycosylhydrolase [Saprospiraceae bacterium]